MPPVYLTSTYARSSLDAKVPFGYARVSHPTRAVLEENVAALEGGSAGHAFASGMAAIEAVFSLLKQGEHAIVTENAYGGTYRLCHRLLEDRGLAFSWANTSDLAAVEQEIRPETRLLFIESPSNPIMALTDIQAMAELSRRHDLVLAVDNTFFTPYFQRPLDLGAHLVVHSATKFLNGHSDVVAGVVVSTNPAHADRIRFVQQSAGAIPGPLDCFLVLRGIKTLPIRMERHDQNGREVARFLEADARVEAVHYPGLASHPQHALALSQSTGFGSIMSFELGGRKAAEEFVAGLELCTLAESLGGVESLVSHPATMSHSSLEEKDRLRMGVTEGLLRLSVGIEDVADILEDLERGLRRIRR